MVAPLRQRGARFKYFRALLLLVVFVASASAKIGAIFFLVLVCSLVANPLSQLAFQGEVDWLNAVSLSFTLAVVLTVFTWYKQVYARKEGKRAVGGKPARKKRSGKK